MILTNATVIARSARLIPNARSGHLSTHSAGVCTPAGTVPDKFRSRQEARTLHYLTDDNPVTARTAPVDAVRFWVESYGVPIAWVTLDGSVGYASDADLTGAVVNAGHGTVNGRSPVLRTMTGHREAVRAAWPESFPQNRD